MASTTGYCLVCGTPTRVVLPESTTPLLAYGGEGAPSLGVPADSVVLCEEHAATDVVAFLADQLKEAKAVEKAADDAAKAAKAAEKAEAAPPAPARRGRSS